MQLECHEKGSLRVPDTIIVVRGSGPDARLVVIANPFLASQSKQPQRRHRLRLIAKQRLASQPGLPAPNVKRRNIKFRNTQNMRWMRKYQELSTFIDVNDRLPRQQISCLKENYLARWWQHNTKLWSLRKLPKERFCTEETQHVPHTPNKNE
eukprot:2069506-Amphidinium_carterae.1